MGLFILEKALHNYLKAKLQIETSDISRDNIIEILNSKQGNVIFDTLQSEEGGRFYREQNRNLIVKVDDTFSNDVPENFTWLTLNQLKKFIVFNNYVNIQARSLISALSYIN